MIGKRVSEPSPAKKPSKPSEGAKHKTKEAAKEKP